MTLKTKLGSRELTIGSWITIGSPIVAEIMAQAGYDWLTIDLEHSAITIAQAQDLIRVIELCGVAPLVRVGENDLTVIKRVMDAGAHGVIVPMVNSKEEAEKAVKAVKYPPVGFRGVGLARAQKYGQNFEGYKSWNLNESVVIVQVEHIRAVENLETILHVDGVDGFIIGPYDLSASLGHPGEFNHPEVLTALERVKTVAIKHNALMGFHVIPTDVETLLDKVKEGYKFLAHSIDILFLGNGSHNSLAAIKSEVSNRQNR